MIPESEFFPVDDRDRLPVMAEQRLRASKKELSEETDRGSSGSLNFKVTPQFKKEFKGYAVSQGISMVELLKEGFALSKKRRSQ
jgi:predicted HicB family RNase H-like nuclease